MELLYRAAAFLAAGDTASGLFDDFGEGKVVPKRWELASNLGQQFSQRSLDPFGERFPIWA